MRLSQIQPSQLYISAAKLARVQAAFDPRQPASLGPLPVVMLEGQVVLTDGHTRAFAAFLAGLDEVLTYWDEDELDWEAYRICVRWCKEAGIRTIADLTERVVDAQAYEQLWRGRCAEMHRALARVRGEGATVVEERAGRG
jgi:hypothetical protein